MRKERRQPRRDPVGHRHSRYVQCACVLACGIIMAACAPHRNVSKGKEVARKYDHVLDTLDWYVFNAASWPSDSLIRSTTPSAIVTRSQDSLVIVIDTNVRIYKTERVTYGQAPLDRREGWWYTYLLPSGTIHHYERYVNGKLVLLKRNQSGYMRSMYVDLSCCP